MGWNQEFDKEIQVDKQRGYEPMTWELEYVVFKFSFVYVVLKS